MHPAIRLILAASCIVLLVAAPQTARAQQQVRPLDPDSSATDVAAQAVTKHLHPHRLAIVSGALAGLNVALYAWEKHRWWGQSSGPFHFDDKLDYARNMDKLAHFYATDVQALVIARSLQWSGVKHQPATLAGSVLALLMQTQVEYHDGLNSSWGFDRFDMVANALGAAWFYAREHVPALERVNVRWFYYRMDQDVPFLDDYSGHSYWVSVPVTTLLPSVARPDWMRFFCISAGVSLNDWRAYPDPGYLSFYLGLDLDFKEILPQGSGLGRFLSDIANRIHLPGPALRIYPRPVLHPLFYGQ